MSHATIQAFHELAAEIVRKKLMKTLSRVGVAAS